MRSCEFGLHCCRVVDGNNEGVVDGVEAGLDALDVAILDNAELLPLKIS